MFGRGPIFKIDTKKQWNRPPPVGLKRKGIGIDVSEPV